MVRDVFCTRCGNKICGVDLLESHGLYHCEKCGTDIQLIDYEEFARSPSYTD